MSTTPPEVRVPGSFLGPDSIPRRFTLADLAHMPSEVPSGPVRYELHRGRLITMPPPGDLHGAIETKFAGTFLYQGEFLGHGVARCGEVMIVLARNPDHVLGADTVFITNASLPLRLSDEGYLLTIPDLVVEVRSKNDTIAELTRKAQEYLSAGVKVVWVADPIQRNVTEHRKDVPLKVYTEDDTLTIEELIPGFALPVRLALRHGPGPGLPE